MPGPKLMPAKVTTESRQVFLEKEMWARLKESARFHSDVFKAMGSTAGVSRNELIENWLEWAFETYWAEKGGYPTSKEDWARKVKRYAEQLRAEADAPPRAGPSTKPEK